MVDFIIDFTYRHCLNRQYQCLSKVNIGMSSTLHKSEGFQSEKLDYAAGKTSGNIFLASVFILGSLLGNISMLCHIHKGKSGTTKNIYICHCLLKHKENSTTVTKCKIRKALLLRLPNKSVQVMSLKEHFQRKTKESSANLVSDIKRI